MIKYMEFRSVMSLLVMNLRVWIILLLIGVRTLIVDRIFNKVSVNTVSIFKGIYGNLVDILGVYFKKALFVPNTSVYNKVGSHSLPATDSQVDLTWQFALQRVWENLMLGDKGK